MLTNRKRKKKNWQSNGGEQMEKSENVQSRMRPCICKIDFFLCLSYLNFCMYLSVTTFFRMKKYCFLFFFAAAAWNIIGIKQKLTPEIMFPIKWNNTNNMSKMRNKKEEYSRQPQKYRQSACLWCNFATTLYSSNQKKGGRKRELVYLRKNI